MSSDLTLAGAPLRLKVSPTARVMRLRLDPRGGGLVLTVPRRVSARRALAWAAGQEPWAEAALAGLAPALPLAPGASIPYRGAPHRIVWDPSLPRRVSLEPGAIRLGGPEEGVGRRVLRWLKSEALDLLRGETVELAASVGVRNPPVAVGDPVSRWGSCSARGGIRYSWRLLMAPDFVRRATVVHEVAHLVHMDHGPAFHALARELLGADPGLARSWLRREGAALHRIGRVQ